MNTASSTAAVRTRVRNKRSGVSRGAQRRQPGCFALCRFELLAGASEAAFTRAVRGESSLERGGIEVRPQRVGEMQFRIGELPEQEVAHAPLAAGADEEVRLRRKAHRQVRGQIRFANFLVCLQLVLFGKPAERLQDVP